MTTCQYLYYVNINLKTNNSKTFRNVRSLKEDNVLMFMDNLKQGQWESVLRSDDVNIAYANFINTFNTLYNLYCPVKKVKIEDTCRKKHWLSYGLKNACRKKNHLYILFLRDRTVISESRYKKYKKQTNFYIKIHRKGVLQ